MERHIVTVRCPASDGRAHLGADPGSQLVYDDCCRRSAIRGAERKRYVPEDSGLPHWRQASGGAGLSLDYHLNLPDFLIPDSQSVGDLDDDDLKFLEGE